jgi:hypothetical protein
MPLRFSRQQVRLCGAALLSRATAAPPPRCGCDRNARPAGAPNAAAHARVRCVRRAGAASLSLGTAARAVSRSRQGSRRTLSGRRLQWPKAVSKWRLEPFAPFDTAFWAYSGCSLRVSTDLYALPSHRYRISFGGNCGERSLAVQARLKTYTEWPVAAVPDGCSGRRLYRSGVLSRSLPSVRPFGPTQDAPFDTALWAHSGCALRVSADLYTLPPATGIASALELCYTRHHSAGRDRRARAWAPRPSPCRAARRICPRETMSPTSSAAESERDVLQ